MCNFINKSPPIWRGNESTKKDLSPSLIAKIKCQDQRLITQILTQFYLAIAYNKLVVGMEGGFGRGNSEVVKPIGNFST